MAEVAAREPEPGFSEVGRRAAAHALVEDLETPVLNGADQRHLVSVLRLREGELVTVTDGRGGWRLCRLGPGGSLVAEGMAGRAERPSPSVCVAFAPVKGDRTEWAVQKLTELGVDRIVVMHTARSVVRWDRARADSHLRKLESVARQAVMQSRGLWLPSVEGVVEFAQAASLPGAVLAEPGGSPVSLEAPTVLVGPEGGWTDEELGAVRREPVSFSTGVLRAETAAVAAGVLLTALRGGLVRPA